MRHVLLALLVGAGLTASVLTVTGQQSTGNRAIESREPRRTGLPPYLNCERPELAALAKELGHRLCVQNDIVTNLNVRGPALESAARAFLSQPWKAETSTDPRAIICRNDYGATDEGDVPVHNLTCAYFSYWRERAATARALAQSTPESYWCGGCEAP
jgi:hypothetical protein